MRKKRKAGGSTGKTERAVVAESKGKSGFKDGGGIAAPADGLKSGGRLDRSNRGRSPFTKAARTS